MARQERLTMSFTGAIKRDDDRVRVEFATKRSSRIIQSNINVMKKILFAFSVISLAAALVYAAEELKTSATSTSEHRVMKPADLK